MSAQVVKPGWGWLRVSLLIASFALPLVAALLLLQLTPQFVRNHQTMGYAGLSATADFYVAYYRYLVFLPLVAVCATVFLTKGWRQAVVSIMISTLASAAAVGLSVWALSRPVAVLAEGAFPPA